MAIKSFIFGGNAEAKTPQELARQRAMIESMSPNFGRAANVGEGVGHALTGLAMGIRSRQANRAETAGRAKGAAAYNNVLDSAFGAKSPAPTTVEAKTPARQKIADVLSKKAEPTKPVEVASLEPNAGQPQNTPAGKGLAALVPSQQGGKLNYLHPWQEAGTQEEIKQITSGAGMEIGQDLNVNSSHRPLAYNRSIGSGDGSQHIPGNAQDISMEGMDVQKRQDLVKAMAQRGAGRMITYANSPNMLHVDTGKRDSEFQPRFMFNGSAHNMDSAPQWFKDSAAVGGVTQPTGADIPIPAQTPQATQTAMNGQEAIAQNFDVDQREREILARTMQAEAGNQGLQGMLDVGSVIQNRVNSGNYGDGVEGVIMKDGQFSAWNGVTGYNGGKGGLDMANMQVSDEAYQAADAILSGQAQDETKGATHYYNNSQVDPKWGQNRAGGEWQQRGAHLFGNADGKKPAYQNMPMVGGGEITSPNDVLQNMPFEVANLGAVDPRAVYKNMPNQVAQPTTQQQILAPQGVERPPVPAYNELSPPNAAAQQPQPQQMAQKATQPQGGLGIRDLIEASQNPWMTDGQREVVNMLLERKMQENDPMRQLEMQKMRQDMQAGQREANAPINVGGVLVDPKTYEPVYQPEQEAPTSVQEYQFYADQARANGQQPLGPLEYRQALKKAASSSTNVTVNGAAAVPEYSKLDKGYVYLRNPDGSVKTDEQGIPQVGAIKGGPADIEAQRIAQTKIAGQDAKERSGNVVLEDIDRVLTGLDEGLLPTSGPVGGALSHIPGTQSYNVGALIETLKANTGFDRLQAMRDSSPTGGALGAINKSEMDLLQAALGNLSQSQDAEQLKFNLRRVKRIYNEIINGKDANVSGDNVDLKDKYGLE